MLKTLRIRDLAVVEDVVVAFGPGLNLLTGETGAGKSILVDALGLATGARADARLVRSGAARAIVEAVFDAPPGSVVLAALEERGLDACEGEIAVRREVAAEGTGRAFVNGAPCALNVLREIGGLLAQIHGQHEQQTLLSIEKHLDLLDRFGALETQAHAVAAAFQRVALACDECAAWVARAAEGERHTAELQRQLREIDAVAPKSGEFEELERERRILRSSGRLAELLERILGALSEGEPSSIALAAQASRATAELASIDPELATFGPRIDSARLELEDVAASLEDLRQRAEFDPDRLERAEARLAALERLRGRYGSSEVEILARRAQVDAELAALGDAEREIARAHAALAAAESEYVGRAAALSAGRAQAAARLARAVEGQLATLALGRARVEVELSPARGRMLTGLAGAPIAVHARGAERVEFLLAANPGEPARPLAKVASGGELSRVMLALHAILDAGSVGSVLVFDEVDAGIGGATADAVGARLAELARREQVLCVTHLPQVAAHAQHHYQVSKRVRGGRTHVDVAPLENAARVDELARMLGGKSVGEASRRNAAELLAAAGAGAAAGTGKGKG